MPTNLVRYQCGGHFHFVTFSCFGRRPYLGGETARNLFERSLERMRVRYEFRVIGYVVMPEHVHLLLSEPCQGCLATALQAVKLSVSLQRQERPFWLARYHDFNVFTPDKAHGKAEVSPSESRRARTGDKTGRLGLVELSTLFDG